MSYSMKIFNTNQLRVWSQSDLNLKEMVVKQCTEEIQNTLKSLNSAWSFMECKTPLILPNDMISKEYTEKDVFRVDKDYTLRPETTAGSFEVAREILNTTKTKPPLCVWQYGPSFRKEESDGATASKMRYIQFDQLEYQCIYSINSKADYRTPIMISVSNLLGWLTNSPCRVVESDRLPSYSETTLDIEAFRNNSRWTEVASVSIRNDFGDNYKVLEIAIGLDRVVDIKTEKNDTK